VPERSVSCRAGIGAGAAALTLTACGAGRLRQSDSSAQNAARRSEGTHARTANEEGSLPMSDLILHNGRITTLDPARAEGSTGETT